MNFSHGRGAFRESQAFGHFARRFYEGKRAAPEEGPRRDMVPKNLSEP